MVRPHFWRTSIDGSTWVEKNAQPMGWDNSLKNSVQMITYRIEWVKCGKWNPGYNLPLSYINRNLSLTLGQMNYSLKHCMETMASKNLFLLLNSFFLLPLEGLTLTIVAFATMEKREKFSRTTSTKFCVSPSQMIQLQMNHSNNWLMRPQLLLGIGAYVAATQNHVVVKQRLERQAKGCSSMQVPWSYSCNG